MPLNLPQVPDRYNKDTEEARNRQLTTEDAQNYKRYSDVELQPGKGGRRGQLLILRSPSGARWSVTVADDGSLSATAL